MQGSMKDNIYDFASVHIELEIVTAITSMELCAYNKQHTVSGMLIAMQLLVAHFVLKN